MSTIESFLERHGYMALLKAFQGLKDLGRAIKYLWRRIDWNVVQVIVLVGLVPAWLIIGAIFFPIFTSYYSR
jgi:hypothetical protein